MSFSSSGYRADPSSSSVGSATAANSSAPTTTTPHRNHRPRPPPPPPAPPYNSNKQQPVVSVAKILGKALSVSSNRSCADCRSLLVDPSQIYASVSPLIDVGVGVSGSGAEDGNGADADAPAKIRPNTFRYNHARFAPPPPPPPPPPIACEDKDATTTTTAGSGKRGGEEHGDGDLNNNDLNDIIENANSGGSGESGESFEVVPAGGDGVGIGLNGATTVISSAGTGGRSVPAVPAPPPPVVEDPPVDPAVVAPSRLGSGGHGVLVCAMCGAAHKLLGPGVAKVHPIQDVSAWTVEEVRGLLGGSGSEPEPQRRQGGLSPSSSGGGGNAWSWRVLEAYVPSYWESKRPKGAESSVADRLAFVRAKYQALLFVLPQPGPLAPQAWRRIVGLHPEWRGLWGADLVDASISEYHGSAVHHHHRHRSDAAVGSLSSGSFAFQSAASLQETRRYELPDRLVDYFCVVTPSDYLDNTHLLSADLSKLKSPEDVLLVPKVSDCFPLPNTHKAEEESHEFPEHVSTFLFPDGCRPSSRGMPPSFFTFVLTASNGDRLYGGVLRLYDDHRDITYLRNVMENSEYAGELPEWLSSVGGMSRESQCSADSAVPSDVIYLPKCLVVISHYPYFDLWRKFLLQIYRIALVESPLPIERFISNFTCEIPLPPPGKTQVKFGYMVKDTWCVERPPENQLPLADFSFKPLFASLSVSNVMVVMSCLLQETRVALVSKYMGILGPVAEALTSLLFPFHWEGLYLPVMPYSMLDILDAPVPYLVGLHSRYLNETKPANRPHGVVFVDLDRDVVHLGYQEDSAEKRNIPCMPERYASKLRTKLEQHAASVYVYPPTQQAGVVTAGDGDIPLDIIPLSQRPSYLNFGSVPDIKAASSSRTRRQVFGDADKAYRDNDLHEPITGFHTEHGQFFEREQSSRNSQSSKDNERPMLQFMRRNQSRRSFSSSSGIKSPTMNRIRKAMSPRDQTDNVITDDCLLDMVDPHGFSTNGIRESFLRFFVSIFMDYRDFLERGGRFRIEDFVSNLHTGSAESADFVTRMLKTQLFNRFIADRRESPNDPEVKLFDASINAKMNRSKRHTIKETLGRPGQHKKRDTTFLDDTSGIISETYTPPPPSNWGLPDDGRSYSYGRFPPLNPDLFGKIRTPRKFNQNRRGSAKLKRRMSVATQAGEQVVLAKAKAPLVRSGSDIIAAAKRGAKSLEHAISALSSPFANVNKEPAEDGSSSPTIKWGSSARKSLGMTRLSVNSELTVPSELGLSMVDDISSAEEVVLNARRKQSILLGIIISFQKACRLHMKGMSRRQQMNRISNVISMRSDQRSREAKQNRAAIKIQACYRGSRVRSNIHRLDLATARIQAVARGRRTRFVFNLVRSAVIKSQAACRGFMTRRRISKLLKGCLQRYRQHIFVLWAQSHTSLCYRTTLWSLIKKDGVIQLGLAEEEILRLWIEFQVQPPSDAQTGLTKDDEIVRIGSQLGVPNTTRTYIRVRKASADKAFNLSLNGVANYTRDRETAERVQVYERLVMAESAQDKRLGKFFERFCLQKDKRKKASLSEMIWNVYAKANDSSAFMLEFFPELQHSPDMHFRDPSKKGVRRAKKLSSITPRPLDKHLCIHTLYGDRLRRNVREVADASLRVVPSLTLRMSKLEDKRRRRDLRDRRLQGIMVDTRKMPDWSSCRLAMMKDFLALRGEFTASTPSTKKSRSGEDVDMFDEAAAAMLLQNSLNSFDFVYPREELWVDEKEDAKENNNHHSAASTAEEAEKKFWNKWNMNVQAQTSRPPGAVNNNTEASESYAI